MMGWVQKDVVGAEGCKERLVEEQLESSLRSRRERGLLRKLSLLKVPSLKYDFASNDYIGLSRHPRLRLLTQTYLDR